MDSLWQFFGNKKVSRRPLHSRYVVMCATSRTYDPMINVVMSSRVVVSAHLCHIGDGWHVLLFLRRRSTYTSSGLLSRSPLRTSAINGTRWKTCFFLLSHLYTESSVYRSGRTPCVVQDRLPGHVSFLGVRHRRNNKTKELVFWHIMNNVWVFSFFLLSLLSFFFSWVRPSVPLFPDPYDCPLMQGCVAIPQTWAPRP